MSEQEVLTSVADEMACEVVANSAGSLHVYKDLFCCDAEATVGAGLVYEAATKYDIGDTDEHLAGFRS